jgi:hypothetical protein
MDFSKVFMDVWIGFHGRWGAAFMDVGIVNFQKDRTGISGMMDSVFQG